MPRESADMNLLSSMKKKVIFISPETTVKEAAEKFTLHHIGTLPVVDGEGKLVGILLIKDLISQALPDFVNIIQDIDFVLDFGAAETRQPDETLLKEPVSTIMQPPVSGKGNSSLLRAAALIKKHNLLDLPVVDDQDRLIGIASLVDIGTRFLQSWNRS
ncbi:MAG: CBS domain-containing protein [Anaerolineaceae bacterium]|jgi:CBS domain-containing protein